jgi:predicted phosphoribosyltransferase
MEAGLMLAAKLHSYKNENGVVLAVPRGAVPIAYVVARELDFPMELVLTKKIGHPMNKEYAIGAASLYDYFVLPHENVTAEYIKEEVTAVRARLQQMYHRYMGDKEPVKLEGKTLIVIDDGIATGNTLLATIHLLKKSKPGKIIIAVPVASSQAVEKLAKEVDEVIAVLVPEVFYGVGAFYEDFEQVSDEEVLYYINKLKQVKKAG